MTDTITLTGLVATDPRHIVTSEGLAITSFRLASAQRRYDKSTSKWVDGETNWYSITCFRQLAINASGSLSKGERIIVTGRQRIRTWDNGERTGMTVDVEADALGHDLLWGTTTFVRSMSTSAAPADAAAEPVAQGPTAPAPGAHERRDSFEPAPVGHTAPEPAF